MIDVQLVVYSLIRAARFRLVQPRPAGTATVRALDGPSMSGSAPVRVLLVGAGVLAGYGVIDHADAVAGPLAARLSTTLGRGVVVQSRVAPLLPLKDVVRFIGPNGAHTYDAVVFAPCFLEGQFAPTTMTARHLDHVIHHLRETGRPGLGLVLLTLPEPTTTDRLNRAVATAAQRQTAIVHRLVDRHSSTSAAAAPPFRSVTDPSPFDAAYYDRVAEVLVAELATLLTSTRAQPM